MTVQPEVSHDLDAAQVARYIVALDSERPEPDVTQLKLQKLLYLAQANYLAATGWRLFDANIEAFEHGPVVHAVLKEYQSYSRSVIAPDNATWDADSVPSDAREFIDSVWNRYQGWTASALRGLTHSQSPWKETYESDAFRKQIPDEAMTDYFRVEVPIEARVFHPNVVVVDRALLDDLDDNEDEIVALAISAQK